MTLDTITTDGLPSCDDPKHELVGEEAYINPNVPFARRIFGGCMKAGTSITITGTTQGTSFQILLTSQTMEDIPLLFSPCFRVGHVVRTSRKKGKWSHIENRSRFLPALPFYLGEPFSICIYCTKKDFMISVNGYHFSDYHHHVPVHLARYLLIQGPLVLHRVAIQRVDLPYPPRTSYEYPSPVGMVPLPCIKDIPVELSPGSSVKIHGKVKCHPRQITMSLQTCTFLLPPPQFVGLFLDVRYGFSHSITASSFEDGTLKEKRTADKFPLLPFTEFCVCIFVQYSYFEITINNESIAELQYLGSPQKLKIIQIFGDMDLKTVEYR